MATINTLDQMHTPNSPGPRESQSELRTHTSGEGVGDRLMATFPNDPIHGHDLTNDAHPSATSSDDSHHGMHC